MEDDFQDFGQGLDYVDPLVLQETPVGDITPQIAAEQVQRPALAQQMTIRQGGREDVVNFGPGGTTVNNIPFAQSDMGMRTPKVWDTNGAGVIVGPSTAPYVLSADAERQVYDIDTRIRNIESGTSQGGPADPLQKKVALGKLLAERSRIDPANVYGEGSIRGRMSPAALAFQKSVYTDPKSGTMWYQTKDGVHPFHPPHLDAIAKARSQAADHAAEAMLTPAKLADLKHRYWKDALAAGHSHDEALRMASEAIGAVGWQPAGQAAVPTPTVGPSPLSPKQAEAARKMTHQQETEFYRRVHDEAKAIRDHNRELMSNASKADPHAKEPPNPDSLAKYGYVSADDIHSEAEQRVLEQYERLSMNTGGRSSRRKSDELAKTSRERTELGAMLLAMPKKPNGGVDLGAASENTLTRIELATNNPAGFGMTSENARKLADLVALEREKRRLSQARVGGVSGPTQVQIPIDPSKPLAARPGYRGR